MLIRVRVLPFEGGNFRDIQNTQSVFRVLMNTHKVSSKTCNTKVETLYSTNRILTTSMPVQYISAGSALQIPAITLGSLFQ
jgi:hypothetical protein